MRWLLLIFLVSIQGWAYGQVGRPTDSLREDSLRVKKFNAKKSVDNTNNQYDFGDLVRNILHPGKKADTLHNPSGITVVPNIAANPTIGGQLGIKAVAGKRLGNDPKTLFSIAATSASYTTKGILYFYVNHNVFTPGNKWNFQGNLVIAKTVSPDYGLGIGRRFKGGSSTDSVLADPTRKAYPINSIYYNVREEGEKNVAKDLFIGAGM